LADAGNDQGTDVDCEPNAVRHWGLYTVFEGRIPEIYVKFVSETSVTRARRILEMTQRTGAQLLHISSITTSPNQCSPSGIAPEEMTEELDPTQHADCNDDFEQAKKFIQILAKTTFVIAPLCAALKAHGFKTRNGKNQGKSDLHLLWRVQDVFIILVKGIPANRSYYIMKMKTDAMSKAQSEYFAEKLVTKYGVDMDQYRVHATEGTIEASSDVLNDHLQGPMLVLCHMAFVTSTFYFCFIALQIFPRNNKVPVNS